jgi:hypothetical protein
VLHAEATMDSGYCYELQFMGRSLKTGKITAPEDAPVSCTAHGHLAGVAVIALTGEGRLDGLQVPPRLCPGSSLFIDPPKNCAHRRISESVC